MPRFLNWGKALGGKYCGLRLAGLELWRGLLRAGGSQNQPFQLPLAILEAYDP